MWRIRQRATSRENRTLRRLALRIAGKSRIRVSTPAEGPHVEVSDAFQAARGEGQAAEANAGGVEDGVADRGSDADDGGFAGSGRRQIFAVDEDGLDFWNVAETRDAVLREVGIRNAAVFRFDRFEQPRRPIP